MRLGYFTNKLLSKRSNRLQSHTLDNLEYELNQYDWWLNTKEDQLITDRSLRIDNDWSENLNARIRRMTSNDTDEFDDE